MGCVRWGGQIAGRRWGEGNWGVVSGDSAWNASACCRHLFIKPLTCLSETLGKSRDPSGPGFCHQLSGDDNGLVLEGAGGPEQDRPAACSGEGQAHVGLCVGPINSPCVWGVPAHTKCLTRPGHSELVPQRLPSSLFTFVLLSLSPAPSARA